MKNNHTVVKWISIIVSIILITGSLCYGTIQGVRIRQLEGMLNKVELHSRLIAVIENELKHINEKLNKLLKE